MLESLRGALAALAAPRRLGFLPLHHGRCAVLFRAGASWGLLVAQERRNRREHPFRHVPLVLGRVFPPGAPAVHRERVYLGILARIRNRLGRKRRRWGDDLSLGRLPPTEEDPSELMGIAS